MAVLFKGLKKIMTQFNRLKIENCLEVNKYVIAVVIQRIILLYSEREVTKKVKKLSGTKCFCYAKFLLTCATILPRLSTHQGEHRTKPILEDRGQRSSSFTPGLFDRKLM